MAIMISETNRNAFSGAMEAMFRDRKRVFVDALEWDLKVVDGEMEIDQFDGDDALYLISLEPLTGQHLASVRLLPTTKPHLMDTVFPHLCEEGVPRGPDTYEMSRVCSNPDLAPEIGAMARAQLLLSLVEYAIANNIKRLTAVCQIQFLSKLLAIGWDCRPLGAPQHVGGALTGAMELNVTPETLSVLHERFGVRQAA